MAARLMPSPSSDQWITRSHAHHIPSQLLICNNCSVHAVCEFDSCCCRCGSSIYGCESFVVLQANLVIVNLAVVKNGIVKRLTGLFLHTRIPRLLRNQGYSDSEALA